MAQRERVPINEPCSEIAAARPPTRHGLYPRLASRLFPPARGSRARWGGKRPGKG
jgi:hypothetical protein